MSSLASWSSEPDESRCRTRTKTILATATGRGAVAIVRLSGRHVAEQEIALPIQIKIQAWANPAEGPTMEL
jgi:hypothetical protein